MPKHEVLREGEPTVDGRFIQHDAVELPNDPVPLWDYDIAQSEPDLEPADARVLVGYLSDFERHESRIFCQSDVNDERPVTVSLLITGREIVGGEDLGISQARIVGGFIGEQMLYPWSD